MRATSDRQQWDAFARIYDEESISPFRRGVRFPFESDVKKTIARWRRDRSLDQRVAVDFGCGPGDSLRVVSGRIGLAIGADYSKSMLDVCRERFDLSAHPRPVREQADRKFEPRTTATSIEDLRDLSHLRGRIDLVTSVNAICPEEPSDAKRMLRELLRAIAPGGTAIIVVPAAESTRDLFRFAEEEGEDFSELGTFDERRNVLTFSKGESQRYLTRPEIESVASKIRGVEIERLEKVEYPWTHMREAGWGYFVGRDRAWDWYAVLRRR